MKCAIHTGTLEARMSVQVTRMARRVMGTVLREIEDTGNTTARNLDTDFRNIYNYKPIQGHGSSIDLSSLLHS